MCYINAPVKAFLNCTAVMNLIQSNLECEVIDELRFLVNGNEVSRSTESLHDLLIMNNYNQFKNNLQMDPDEFIRCFLDLSKSLTDICTINVDIKYTCNVCCKVTHTSNAVYIALQAPIMGNSIIKILKIYIFCTLNHYSLKFVLGRLPFQHFFFFFF